ncbi:hypothetical protein [Arthrobacter sp. GMC3]|uniref:hypothetical protein n=1 Tax=Arthrobacter sp. GMC3 TaxID=2058894 RepID=UPI0011B0985C|nr:hypothetical protein [Arthrobacter sp. GMC3]
MEEKFDQRYPAIFQPGGNELPRVTTTASKSEPRTSSVGPAHPVDVETSSSPTTTAQPLAPSVETPGLWRGWIAPLAAAAAMLSAGVFVITAQYWLAASMVVGPADSLGVEPEPWGQSVNRAAPALLTVGFGLLAVVLFLASRNRPATETAARNAFVVLALCLGVAGWIALYAFYLFPEQAQFSGAAYDGTPRRTPWPFVVMPCGPALLTVALVMLAVLIVVPRRWPINPAGAEDSGTVQASGKPSIGRGICFGLVAAVAGVMALVAPTLFQQPQNMRSGEGDSVVTVFPSWPELMQYLSPPLLVVSLGTLAWAAIHLAVRNSAASQASAAVEL